MTDSSKGEAEDAHSYSLEVLLFNMAKGRRPRSSKASIDRDTESNPMTDDSDQHASDPLLSLRSRQEEEPSCKDILKTGKLLMGTNSGVLSPLSVVRVWALCTTGLVYHSHARLGRACVKRSERERVAAGKKEKRGKDSWRCVFFSCLHDLSSDHATDVGDRAKLGGRA